MDSERRSKDLVDPGAADRIEALEQALIDERAARAEAQRRAADLEQRATTWRERAEARSARVEALERERDSTRGPAGWLRGQIRQIRSPDRPRRDEGPAGGAFPDGRHRIRRLIPGTSIAHNATGALAHILDQGGAVPLDALPWDAVDMIVVDPDTSGDSAARLSDWLGRSPRPPTIVVSDEPDRWEGADLVITNRPTAGGSALAVPEPIDLGAVASGARGESPADDSSDADAGRPPAGIEATLDESTDGKVATAAALGVPVAPTDAERRDPRTSARSRRWAWAERDPAVLLERILDAAGVTHKPVDPTVAGLLVSNRPDRVVAAIDGAMAQRHPLDELVVVCHGFDAAIVTEAIRDRPWHDVLTVVAMPEGSTLGACTNEAALLTTATVLAKLDDDDFYGPGYVLDALHALRYSGAPVVGKAAQFTYVEAGHRTVVRRAGTEETFVDGTLTGATLVFERSMWDEVRFPDRPRMIDIHFLRGVRAAGGSIYANSRWEFVYRRGEGGHTWDADDDVFLRGSEPAWDGWHPDRACV